MDRAARATDKEIKRLERELASVYAEAERDLQAKLDDFVKRFKTKDAILRQRVRDGEVSEKDYQAWLKGQVFQAKQWKLKQEEVQNTLTRANEASIDIINGRAHSVFADNVNYMSYTMERGAGVNFGFALYDRDAVANLVANNPKVLPEWKVNKPKDYTWNKKKVNRQITQGIIQGESLEQIAKRLATNLSTQNLNHMRTFARTAMTGAQNSGRDFSLTRARNLGINVTKEWMATLDLHTRDSHRHMDGEKIPVGDEFRFSNGLRYPGDPDGPAREVYNCRCTMVGDLTDYPSEYNRYDNIGGKLVKNMTYNEWYQAKGLTHKVADRVMSTARRTERTITRDLKIASSGGDGHLEGLDFRFKGRGSLERKIVDKSAEKRISQEAYARQITDALRYTNLSNSNTLVSDFKTMRGVLEGKGYRMVEVINTLKDKDVEYRGINTLVRAPNGYIFELQFHTPQSLEIKEVNHLLYEEQRLSTTSEARKKELGQQMVRNANRIEMPKDIQDIDNKLLDKKIKQW